MLEDARAPVGERQRQRLPGQVLGAHLDPVRALRAHKLCSASFPLGKLEIRSQLLRPSTQHAFVAVQPYHNQVGAPT